MSDEPQEEMVTLRYDPVRGIDLLHLPEIEYLDTEPWSVTVGLSREWVATLRDVLDGWLLAQNYTLRGCNASMSCMTRGECHRCRGGGAQVCTCGHEVNRHGSGLGCVECRCPHPTGELVVSGGA